MTAELPPTALAAPHTELAVEMIMVYYYEAADAPPLFYCIYYGYY